MFGITRLKAVPPAAVVDELLDEGVPTIEDYILDEVLLEQCAIRKTAAAMLLHENATWAIAGMDFGNEGFDALLYSLAALEVNRPKATAKPVASAKPKPKTTAKSNAKSTSQAKAKTATRSNAKPGAKTKAKAKNTTKR